MDDVVKAAELREFCSCIILKLFDSLATATLLRAPATAMCNSSSATCRHRLAVYLHLLRQQNNDNDCNKTIL